MNRDLLFHGPVLIVSKSHIQSHVHRLEPMDDVVIRRIDGAGHTVAFDRFLGLFSSKAAVEEAEHVPILRDKLRQLLQRDHLLLGSHDYKELVAAFNSLPKEELFRASLDELRQELNAIIDSFGDTDVRVTMLSDAQRNIVVVMVLLPRERFSSEVRMQIQQALARRLDADAGLLPSGIARRVQRASAFLFRRGETRPRYPCRRCKPKSQR